MLFLMKNKFYTAHWDQKQKISPLEKWEVRSILTISKDFFWIMYPAESQWEKKI